MKGTITPDFLIVGSNSLLNKDYTKTIEPYSIIGGAPAKFIKKGYERIFDLNIEQKYNECFKRIL
jgi:acetyltransferase-like isoleucine patch superfamily enzyme